MTREKLLRYGKEYLHDLETACCKIEELHLNFVRESIKALEQEPILNKIRAEIEQSRQFYEASMDYTDGAKEQALSWVLDVIDKYKGESEKTTMSDIKNLIIETANRRDLTFAQNFNGRAYALMDVNWIGYFDTLDEVLEYLGISVKIDNVESEE